MARVFLACVASCVGLAAPLRADVVDVAASGFTVHIVTFAKAPVARVYETLVKPALWWSPDHTYSGNPANLALDPSAGGCWCERLPNGAIEHMRVVFVDRGKTLRLRGGLGPLQTMGVEGAMSIVLKESAGATTVDFVYTVGGYAKGGFEPIAKAVDGVLSEQVARLKKAAETGHPD